MMPSSIVPGSYLPTRVKKELDWKLPIQKGAKGMPAKRVQEWLSLHGFSLVPDGDFGSATDKRLREFQAARGLPANGIVDAATHERLVEPLVRAQAPIAPAGRSLSDMIVAFSAQHIAQNALEAGGDNSGPWVRAYLGWDGLAARWCAGFVCMALEQACHQLKAAQPIASSAGCDALALGAKGAGRFVSEGKVSSGAFPKASINPGSFFLVRRTKTDWVHVGIVEDADPATFDTLEGNTDGNSPFNGNEATRRVRGYASKDFIVW